MKKVYRSQDEKIIAGVCGGFAEYFGIDPTIVRLVWIFFTIFGGLGVLAYIISLVLIPENGAPKSNEITAESDQDEKMVIWGVVIIIVGILLFFRHRPAVGIIWHSLSGNWVNILLAIALIGLGIYVLVNRKKKDGASINNLQFSGLHLSVSDKKLAGVCGGIAETINIDSTIIRLIWVLGTLISAGIGVVLYIICMLVFNKNSDDLVETK